MGISKRTTAVGIVTVFTIGSAALFAQWPEFMPPGTPLTADGTIDMAAPAPRAADGKVDLSGVWVTVAGRPGGRGRGRGRGDAPPPGPPPPPVAGSGELPPSGGLFGNIGAQIPGGAPYQPWAEALVKQRMADNSKDNPDAHCLPLGILQNETHPYPKKIIQTPSEVLLIYEGSGTTVREIYLDGRSMPDPDAQPWYQGYSIGRWEDDETLVVETTNFVDDETWTTWLDVRGSPLSQHGTIIERFRRPFYGGLQIEITIDDPKVYTRPFTAILNNRLLPDTQLIEFFCLDKDAVHYVGASGVADAELEQQGTPPGDGQ